MKDYPLPHSYDDIKIPEEQQKLKFLHKVPMYPASVRPPKMMKNLYLIRGEEEVHTDFHHKQYGIVALEGGFLKWNHIEMIRMDISRRIETKKMFATWRIDSPWKAVSRKGQGKRMGGGKASIDHYVTPVKAKRVIIEVSGKCSFQEVYPMLRIIAEKLPFPAIATSQEMLEESRRKEKEAEESNINPYTFKYLVQNNFIDIHRWIKEVDHKYYGKYKF